MRRLKYERRENFLWRAHDTGGLKKFGLKRWNKANIGWGSTETSVASKVYGAKMLGQKGTIIEVFQTDLSKDGNTVYHSTRLY
jgi:hypothetical protein